ncbi:MAG: DEAD/DEAH box helicase, partial [Bacteroidetes bacterium]
MQYHDTRFGWHERRQTRTTLNMQGDEVRILQVRRNPEQEAPLLDKLRTLPLRRSEQAATFELAEQQDNAFALLEWLIAQRSHLEAAGFTLEAPEHEDKRLQLQMPRLALEVESEMDWFDLKGIVEVGEHRFPFWKLARYIRQENRFYPLPDGTYFLIPEEWMTRYKQIADFGQVQGDELRLAKSQYTLLNTLDIPKPVDLEMSEPVDYVPSPLLTAQLRPYQLEGVRWLAKLYHNGLGACLADDMGLGKTLQTIAILLYAKEQRAARKAEQAQEPASSPASGQLRLFAPAGDEQFLKPLNALIILPASLLFNWESEIKKFVPSFSVYQHFGPKRYRDGRLLARFDVILTTYQTAQRDGDLLEQLDFEYIILDESQQIKNRNSKVFKAINRLRASHKISLSGTPIENSLSDLWSQMQFINEGLLGSFAFFKREFIIPIEKQQDEEKKHKLRQLVAPYLLRRTKEQVAKDLPELTTQVFYTEMSAAQRKLYEKEKSAARNYLLDNFAAQDAKYRMLVVQTLTRLRQLANHPLLIFEDYDKTSGKFQDVIEQLDVIHRGGHKVLLFSSFVKHLSLFRAYFESKNIPYAWLSGSSTAPQRKQNIQLFQEDPTVQSFLISIKSGGTGLNLTAADYVFILDPWWNPTIEQQAIARAHRIGQQSHVIASKFITRDSIEEKILKLQQKKSQLAEDIIGADHKLGMEQEELDYLLR